MRARVLSSLSLSLVWWFIKRRDFTTEREREREKDLNIIVFKILPVKDEFYLDHDHHPFGVVAVFDATSFVDE